MVRRRSSMRRPRGRRVRSSRSELKCFDYISATSGTAPLTSQVFSTVNGPSGVGGQYQWVKAQANNAGRLISMCPQGTTQNSRIANNVTGKYILLDYDVAAATAYNYYDPEVTSGGVS